MKQLETEIVVIAAGPAGLAAAVQAAEDGASVIVLEKASLPGGAANMGMGPLGIGTKYQKNAMNDITVQKAFEMFMEYTHYMVDARLVKKYFERSGKTIEWLEDMGVEFEGSFKYFPKSEATWHIVKTDKGIGPRAASFMIKAMSERASELGVEIMLETPASKIIMEDGRVTGVLAKDKSGEEIQINCKAAIIATGGAGANPDMIREYTGFKFNENMFNFAIPGLIGEGMKMAWESGAGKSTIRIEMAASTMTPPDAPGCVGNAFRQPNILVNKLGKRFMNEEHMQNATFLSNAVSRQKDMMAHVILDTATLKYYKKNGLDVVSFVHTDTDVDDFVEGVTNAVENNDPYIFVADNIEELAEKLGIDPDTLMDTVDEYNDMCDTKDTEFFKDDRYMRPVAKAPFYCGTIRPGGYGTVGGVKINENAEAITEDFEVIPGLYCAGTDSCAIYDDSYMFLLPGNTMGYAVNTGRFAGESAAEYVQDN